MKSSIREMQDNLTKAGEKGCSKITQRSFKTGLSYKYKAIQREGTMKPRPSETLHDASGIVLILLQKGQS